MNTDLIPEEPKTFRLRALIILVLLFFLAYFEHTKPGHVCSPSRLFSINQKYLEEANDEALGLFVLLSGMKSGLAVMNSSQAGISFIVDINVQVGQFIQSALDMVSTGWNASLLSLCTLGVMRMFLDHLNTHISFLLQAVFLLTAFHYALLFIFGVPIKVLSNFLRLGIAFGFILSLGLPFAVYLASITSVYITQDERAKVQKEMTSSYGKFNLKHEEGNLSSQAHTAVQTFSDSSKELPEQHKHLSEWIVRHLIVVFFDAVAFPLGFVCMSFFVFNGLSSFITYHT